MTVTLFSKPACVQCTMTSRLLDQLGIEYVVRDVTTDAQALAIVMKLGYMQAPVVVVGDEEDGRHWSGFQPDRVKELQLVAA